MVSWRRNKKFVPRVHWVDTKTMWRDLQNKGELEKYNMYILVCWINCVWFKNLRYLSFVPINFICVVDSQIRQIPTLTHHFPAVLSNPKAFEIDLDGSSHVDQAFTTAQHIQCMFTVVVQRMWRSQATSSCGVWSSESPGEQRPRGDYKVAWQERSHSEDGVVSSSHEGDDICRGFNGAGRGSGRDETTGRR